MIRLRSLCVSLALLSIAAPASAQYFGRNKVQVKNFDFQVLKTDHFDIYYYSREEAAATRAARLAERWYSRLSQFFGRSLSSQQPVIIYASHPDFEQTHVVEGFIDEGTGGVTEGAMRRVTLPLGASLAETDHVLGHELVHAFQYDMLDRRSAAYLPLWFIEGMAEYLSLGPESVQTSMWMRDAAIEGRLPDIDELDDPDYFPYRFGHAFWAYLAGRFGDEFVSHALNMLGDAGDRGLDGIGVIEQLSGETHEQLSEEWHASIRATYHVPALTEEQVKQRRDAPAQPLVAGGVVIGKDSGGRINIGPALSPDGTKLTFLSERSRLSIDLYLADAATGKVIRKLVSTATDPHFDSLQFLNSAGSFAPDNRRLALATVRGGRAVMAIVDTETGDITEEFPVPDVGEIFQPAWAPDGSAIAFSAQVRGETDLYVMDLPSGTVRALTTDAFADLQPAWTPDSRRIIFVTDRFTASLDRLAGGRYQLASIARDTGAPAPLDTGLAGQAINPQITRDGTVFFVSDARGRPEVYALRAGRTALVLPAVTGVSGITPLSPAIAAAANASQLAASFFHDGGFDLHVIDTSVAANATALPGAASGDTPAMLPPPQRDSGAIGRYIAQPSAPPPAPTDPAARGPYEPKLSLVAAGTEVGVAAVNQFGSYLGGGVGFLFSDVLNRHQLAVNAQVNGTVKDISAGTEYLNRTHRLNWGAFVQRSPYVSGTFSSAITDGDFPEYSETTNRFRQTYTSAGLITQYPFSRSSRLEFNVSGTHIGFDNERVTYRYSLLDGQLIARDTVDLPSPDGINVGTAALALVRDTSVNGATGPILGQRFRFEAAPTFGDLRMTNVTADLRQYVMPVRPVTLAGRALHIARYGGSSEDERLTPFYLGYPGLVRGYSIDSFDNRECVPTEASACPQFDQLVGSRLLLFSAEVRAPLYGLFKGRVAYGPLPVDLFGFFDAGVAWTRDARPSFNDGARQWARSVGAGVRVNAFGYAVLELALARPLDRPSRGWMFVFNLQPGF